MSPKRWAWLDEDGDLQVFVPGLMATGILVSIGMLIWDGIKKLLPDLGRRQHAARLATRVGGRLSDVSSVERGEAPSRFIVARVRRSRVTALGLALLGAASTGFVWMMTFEAYNANAGTLSGRGWTLTLGLGIAFLIGSLTALWLLSAVLGKRQPRWLEETHARWPVGVLPKGPGGDA